MLPLLTVLVPALVKGAELLIPKKDGQSNGDAKLEFVMSLVEKAYDGLGAKYMPDWESIDEKRLFMKLARVVVEECVMAAKKQ